MAGVREFDICTIWSFSFLPDFPLLVRLDLQAAHLLGHLARVARLNLLPQLPPVRSNRAARISGDA
eukprot:757329-Prorocentrum_minimum.AAC.1